MIGSLRGKILEKNAPEVLLEVCGVGYELAVPMMSFYKLPEPGQETFLYVAHIIKEDSESMYGFADKSSKKLFLELIKVSGIGPKTALAVLSAMTPEDFAGTIRDGSYQPLTKIPGVGKKTAERIVVEMRDRVTEWADPKTQAEVKSSGIDAPLLPDANQEEEEACQAIVSLGYKPQWASAAVHKVFKKGMSPEDIIKAVLATV
ncbi:Holliday junction branch migration protein RuvA [Succinimonas amylolytica]|uniref:Holliday junction branch migration protein RuvA n=1 Tax=Succinimonas amylolytica TaxID=83769 RepID=UPI00037F0CBF|nr:Holliday junction branch migration protein RuvA [Succinimonas amylolytica]